MAQRGSETATYFKTLFPTFSCSLLLVSLFLSSFSQQWPTTTTMFSQWEVSNFVRIFLSIFPQYLCLMFLLIFLLCNVFQTKFLFFVSQHYSMNLPMKGVELTMLIFLRFECLFFSYSNFSYSNLLPRVFGCWMVYCVLLYFNWFLILNVNIFCRNWEWFRP